MNLSPIKDSPNIKLPQNNDYLSDKWSANTKNLEKEGRYPYVKIQIKSYFEKKLIFRKKLEKRSKNSKSVLLIMREEYFGKIDFCNYSLRCLEIEGGGKEFC